MPNNEPKKQTVEQMRKGSDFLTVFLMIVILFGFCVCIFILPDQVYSEQENRYLQQFPKIFSSEEGTLWERIENGTFLDRLFDGSFTGKIADYYSDQFPLRDLFVGWKASFETLLGKRENNNVVIGENGNIIVRKDYFDRKEIEKTADLFERFDAAIEKLGLNLTVSVAGRNQDVLSSFLPVGFPRNTSEELWETIDTQMGEKKFDYCNLMTPLKSHADNGEYVYYKTDHHWTTLGAYYAYCEVITALGKEPFALDTFVVETVSEEFYGTTWSSSGMKWIAPDCMEYFRYEGDENFTTEILDTGRKFDGFYDLSFLKKKDKYSSFISGNNEVVKISQKNPSVERETLILFKDSFAHSLVPFLARHYDLILYDLRYTKQSMYEVLQNLVQEEGVQVSQVLAVYNADSLGAGNSIGVLGIRLPKE